MSTQDSFKAMIIGVLKEGVHEIIFSKINGDQRSMKATLDSKFIPKEEPTKDKRKKKSNPDICEVYDTEAKGWRSFRWDNLKFMNGVCIG